MHVRFEHRNMLSFVAALSLIAFIFSKTNQFQIVFDAQAIFQPLLLFGVFVWLAFITVVLVRNFRAL